MAEENLTDLSSIPTPGSSNLSLHNDCLPPDFLESKIIEFSKLFNSSLRLSLLNCDQSKKENYIYLLMGLKKSIKLALEELGKGLINRTFSFRCGLCDELIQINQNENFWSSLQNHEHFEELYYQFLNNELEIAPLTNNVDSFVAESESNVLTEDSNNTGDSNTDSGIEQQDMEPPTRDHNHSESTVEGRSSDEENVNNFRFNFTPPYDKEVQGKVFPLSIVSQIQKYDNNKDFTIMRINGGQAACLICHCEIKGQRIKKNGLIDHVLGQKHMREARDQTNIINLHTFHEFWLKQEPVIQAHIVYFRPTNPYQPFCILCLKKCNYKDIISHIESGLHKKKVLDMFEQGNSLYFLIDLQVQAYGITLEQISEKAARLAKARREANSESNRKDVKSSAKKSESDSPVEAKKPASKEITHNFIKSVAKPESTDAFDLIPHRFKEHLRYFKRVTENNSTQIRCSCCAVNLQDNITNLKNHLISSSVHRRLIKNIKYTFYCEICDVKVKTEFEWMRHDFSAGRHLTMADSRKSRVTEYECIACKEIIFGDDISLIRHSSYSNNKESKKKGGQLPTEIKKIYESKEKIMSHASSLVAEAEYVLKNSLTNDCCRRLQAVLSEAFPECKVYPFGSRISGLGNRDSDLDVFVDRGGTYYGHRCQDAHFQVLAIKQAHKAIHKSKEYDNIVQVLTARTPILKLRHLPTLLDCDLSFKHGLSVENTKFLRFCMELQPVCQQLILLVKEWAEYVYFDRITTYSLAMLCIFYLQTTGFLLSVEEIRRINNARSKSIGVWDTINYVLPLSEFKTRIKIYTNTVCELLKEFFKYYSKFDFNSYVVCPLLGQVVMRSLFEGDPKNLPREMHTYLTQLDSDEGEWFRSNSYMCIQDPFDLSHNLTKALAPGTLTKFQNMCKLSLTHLETID